MSYSGTTNRIIFVQICFPKM